MGMMEKIFYPTILFLKIYTKKISNHFLIFYPLNETPEATTLRMQQQKKHLKKIIRSGLMFWKCVFHGAFSILEELRPNGVFVRYLKKKNMRSWSENSPNFTQKHFQTCRRPCNS